MEFRGENAQDPKQEAEWREAQSIAVTPNLIAAARAQLLFLATVDRHRSLYNDGVVLRNAIRRYKNCWLPLLVKKQEFLELVDPLVVPLDCEWIWHCHRLNPVQYRSDCEAVFGKILDNENVKSVTEIAFVDPMIKLWETLYPGECFELDYLEDNISNGTAEVEPNELNAVTFHYDLVAAVKRQSSFYYQVSRPTMHDKRFLEAAFERYKCFLHLIRRNHEKSIKQFAVPTYDVDLMWHSHQLQPLSYCTDLIRLVGRVLEHDDKVSDRSKGKKLDVGFTETTKLWEDTFGSRYWRAGAMYRGGIPSPVVTSPYKSTTSGSALPCSYQKYLPQMNAKFVEVFLEALDVKNIGDHKKGTLFVSFKKDRSDPFLKGDSSLSIQSVTGKREIASFRCDPTGYLVLTLLSETSFMRVHMIEKNIGTITISLKDILDGDSKLAVEKWFELPPNSRKGYPEPIFLRVAVSCTVPTPSPCTFHLVKWPTISRNTCFSPFFSKGQQLKHHACFRDSSGHEVIQLYMRLSGHKGTEGRSRFQQVVGFTKASGKGHVLAEFFDNAWSLFDSEFVLSVGKNVNEVGHIFELQGEHQLKLFPGQRLEFEDGPCNCMKLNRCDFITVVQFSVNVPYGKALALVNTKTGTLEVNEDWFTLPGLVLTFILWSSLRSKGYGSFTLSVVSQEKNLNSKAPDANANHIHDENPPPNPSKEHKIPCRGLCGGLCYDGTEMSTQTKEEDSEPQSCSCNECAGSTCADESTKTKCGACGDCPLAKKVPVAVGCVQVHGAIR